MTTVIIKARNFIIDDPVIISEIDRLAITHLRPKIQKDYDGELIIGMHRGGIGNTSRFDVAIRRNDAYYIRTPGCLDCFAGEQVSIYRDSTIFKIFSEVFRIKPITFKLVDTNTKKIEYKTEPYFTKMGVLVLPALYAQEHFGRKLLLQRMSFGSNDPSSIASGIICVHPVPFNEKHELSFKISLDKYSAKINGLSRIVNMIKASGKNIFCFKYIGINYNKEFPNGLLTFKETV